jgi:Flp pilus assembly protein TadB
MATWRRGLDRAQPWFLLQLAPLLFAFAIVALVGLPSPYGFLLALASLALLATCVVIALRRRRSSP